MGRKGKNRQAHEDGCEPTKVDEGSQDVLVVILDGFNELPI